MLQDFKELLCGFPSTRNRDSPKTLASFGASPTGITLDPGIDGV